MTTDTETRVRSGLEQHARTMRVADRPSLDDLLSPARSRHVVRPPSVRPLVALAAAVVVVVAAIALLRLHDSTPPAVRTTLRPSSPVVWPLGADDVPRDVQSSPGRAGFAYVNDVLHLGREWYFQDQEPDGDNWVQRHYRHDTLDLQLWVDLARIDDLWFVTNVRAAEGPVVSAEVVGDHVALDAVLAGQMPPESTWGPLDVELLADDGTLLDSAQLASGEGGWRADLQPGDGTAAAVRVTTEVTDPATGASATLTASSIVLPASVADADGPARELFPAVRPVNTYRDAWAYTLTHPGDPRADWRWALTDYISIVMNGGVPPAPTFSDVVTRTDGLQMSGRFAAADGGAGTFELARLRSDGPWFLLSLVDDAYDVSDVTTTATGVEATVALREDTTMALGCGCRAPAGRTLDQVVGRAGEDFVIVRPFEPAGATTPVAMITVAFKAVDDGSLFRYFDAWSP